MQDDTLLRAKLVALRKGAIPPDQLFGLIHDFGHAMFLEAGPDVVALLNHPEYEIRCIAVRVLTFHWDVGTHRDEVIRVLRHDPDDHVKSYAATGLGFVFRNSHDPIVSQVLIDKVRERDEDGLVRESAYTALRDVWSPPNINRADIKAEFRGRKEEEKDLFAARSHEEFISKLWMWKEERSLRIDWEFVEQVERAIQGENSG